MKPETRIYYIMIFSFTYSTVGEGGLLLSPYVDAPVEPWKSDFLYMYIPNFRLITHPSINTIFARQAPKFAQIVLFTIIWSKYTQFLNLVSFISDENPQ